VTRHPEASRRLLTGALAALALVLFARLALRHVGDSYFLADQVDQLQSFEALLRLDPEGLWGPVMSGTTARALGPFGAFVFGLPVALGFGIDAGHTFTSLLLVMATGIAFWQLVRIDAVLAWVWLMVFLSMRMVWWSAAMFWVNTLLLPLGLLLLTLFAALLERSSMAKLAAMTLVLMCALQQHLIALVALPVLAVAIVVFWRAEAPGPHARGTEPPYPPSAHGPGRLVLALGSVVAVGLLPYVIAEGRTGFRNTHAMFSHVNSVAHSATGVGPQAALETLRLATDPMGVTSSPPMAILVGSAIVLVAFVLVWWRRAYTTSPGAREHDGRLLWLLVTTVTCLAGQALFFLLMARPINGLHYAILLAPWYPIPAAVLVAGLVPRGNGAAAAAPATLGLVAIGLLLVRAPVLADRYAERTPWTYHAIVAALDSLCAGEPVDTLEGPGLVVESTPSSDTVLRYLMKRGYVRCRYEPGADVLIVANRSGNFDESLEANGRTFVRERLLEPGIARYHIR